MKVNTYFFFFFLLVTLTQGAQYSMFVPFFEEVKVGYRDKPQDSWRQSTPEPHCKMDLMKKNKIYNISGKGGELWLRN